MSETNYQCNTEELLMRDDINEAFEQHDANVGIRLDINPETIDQLFEAPIYVMAGRVDDREAHAYGVSGIELWYSKDDMNGFGKAIILSDEKRTNAQKVIVVPDNQAPYELTSKDRTELDTTLIKAIRDILQHTEWDWQLSQARADKIKMDTSSFSSLLS